ncbi:hypothetical protein M0805_006030 [Coniferiporia weirii]|nr:hypothetical protein M0805_006030 [Coniferiporia weirii]
MSPKSDSSRSPTRRAAAQPKSSRQQFSACGACRMRRVKCDLKDLQTANPSAGHATCSNCQERGLKCVDEFAEVKAVKLLRRGRRLQQVEAVYGKAADEERRYSPPTHSTCIPKLRPEFFGSPFFRAFLIQRPIIDPVEFPSRYFEAHKGNADALGSVGNLVCMVIAAWAASYGVNEAGEPEPHVGQHAIRVRRDRTSTMVRELLHLIDLHGVLRKPTWDGVRVLLLVLPLTEDVQTPMERLAMYEAAVNQVYTLCSLASVSSINSGQGDYVDAAVRARIFWYAHVHEGVTTGLRGGRLLLSDDDLAAFERTLLPVGTHIPASALGYSLALRYAKTPVRLSSVCRQVHATLTGPKARQRGEIDASQLHDIWNSLGHAWEDLESLRHYPTGDFNQPLEVDRFVNGWQIIIFECFNVLRDALKQRLVACPDDEANFLPHSHSTRSSRLQVAQLHAIADARCQQFARLVIAIVRRHLGTPFFEYDASLVRDGCFYAGLLLAGESGTEEEVNACIQALRDMRWAFSKSEERERSLKVVWERRMAAEVHRRAQADLRGTVPVQQESSASQSPFGSASTTPDEDRMRNPPPPLLISHTPASLHGSSPSTAVTEDGGWSVLSGAPLGVHSHRSSSGSPPFVGANHKVEALESSLLLAPIGEHSLAASMYYPQVPEMDTFAYSIVSNSTSAPHSPHDFTPPRSSTGMSSSSATSFHDTYLDSTGAPFFTVSPPGSARGTADASGSLPSDKGGPYHVNYTGSQFYATP